jgi:hypothetical protein
MWRENEVAQDDDRARRLLGAKTLSREQGPNFDLIGTSRKVIIREIYEWSCSSPVWCISIQIIVTLMNISDRLLVAVIS